MDVGRTGNVAISGSKRRRTSSCTCPGPHEGFSRHHGQPAAPAGEVGRSAAGEHFVPYKETQGEVEHDIFHVASCGGRGHRVAPGDPSGGTGRLGRETGGGGRVEEGLLAALGDSFEYLGGEVGRIDQGTRIGSTKAERFWFAKVRPKRAGEFAFTYTARFDYPANVKKKIEWPERAEYTMPIRIGERGASRVIRPDFFSGSTSPHANVGDTLIIPIHVDRYLTGHTFATPDKDDSSVKAFFSVANENTHERHMERAAAKPVVRNEAADRLQLMASWGSSTVNRSLTKTSHTLTAYLEFTKSGEFNLGGRLADADEKTGDAGTAFRVVPKDKPVTVVLQSIWPYRRGYTSHGSVGCGTLVVRIGGSGSDRMRRVLHRYRVRRGISTGVVVVRPFKGIENYTPEGKK